MPSKKPAPQGNAAKISKAFAQTIAIPSLTLGTLVSHLPNHLTGPYLEPQPSSPSSPSSASTSAPLPLRIVVSDRTVENPDGARDLSQTEIRDLLMHRDLMLELLEVDYFYPEYSFDDGMGLGDPRLVIVCKDVGPKVYRIPLHREPAPQQLLQGGDLSQEEVYWPQGEPVQREDVEMQRAIAGFGEGLMRTLHRGEEPQAPEGTVDDLPFDMEGLDDGPDVIDDDDLPF